jgi:hypothetical protein
LQIADCGLTIEIVNYPLALSSFHNPHSPIRNH